MAHKPSFMTEQEAYEEWLGRLDEAVTLPETIDKLQQYLKEEFGITGTAQIAALESAYPSIVKWLEHEIKQVTITYPWGREIRYGIQGMPGLWSWASVQALREGEEW